MTDCQAPQGVCIGPQERDPLCPCEMNNNLRSMRFYVWEGEELGIVAYLDNLDQGGSWSDNNPFDHSPWIDVTNCHGDISIDGDLTIEELEAIVAWLRAATQPSLANSPEPEAQSALASRAGDRHNPD